MRLQRLAAPALALALTACTANETVINVPQGVSAHVVDEIALVAVRNGDDVTLFLAGDRRQEVLQFCVPDQLLTTAESGSSWSLDGMKLSGPSPSDLDQIRSKVTDTGQVSVFIDNVIPAEDLSELNDSPTPFRPRLGPEWPERFKAPAAYCPSNDG